MSESSVLAKSPTVKGSNKFVIEGYSLAKGIGVISSRNFSVGGHQWAFYFYPYGKNPEEKSAYVSSEGSDVRALFELTLIDQSDQRKHKVLCHFDRSLGIGPYTLKYHGSMWSTYHHIIVCAGSDLRQNPPLVPIEGGGSNVTSSTPDGVRIDEGKDRVVEDNDAELEAKKLEDEKKLLANPIEVYETLGNGERVLRGSFYLYPVYGYSSFARLVQLSYPIHTEIREQLAHVLWPWWPLYTNTQYISNKGTIMDPLSMRWKTFKGKLNHVLVNRRNQREDVVLLQKYKGQKIVRTLEIPKCYITSYKTLIRIIHFYSTSDDGTEPIGDIRYAWAHHVCIHTDGNGKEIGHNPEEEFMYFDDDDEEDDGDDDDDDEEEEEEQENKEEKEQEKEEAQMENLDEKYDFTGFVRKLQYIHVRPVSDFMGKLIIGGVEVELAQAQAGLLEAEPGLVEAETGPTEAQVALAEAQTGQAEAEADSPSQD